MYVSLSLFILAGTALVLGCDAVTDTMKTTYIKKENVKRNFLLIDADGLVLGRLATNVASILRGKHKPTYHPSGDVGDYIIIINADKVILTGKKNKDKLYYWHSQYPGGLKSRTYGELMKKQPERVIRRAVAGMLTDNSLSRVILRRLKIYKGSNHPHNAQNPVNYKLS